MATLDRQYELPGRKYFSNTAMPNLYNNIASDLIETHFIALTADMWSNIDMSLYISITVQYVSKD